MWTGLVLSLGLVTALNCPVVECGSTPDGTCAKVSGANIIVSNCTGEFTCYVSDLLSIWPTEGASLKCASKPRVAFSMAWERLAIVAPRFYSLYSENSSTKRQNGAHPRQCNGDSDCSLVDGSYGFCTCGLDGKGYCQYEKGDNIFADLAIAGNMSDTAQMLFLMTIIQLYPLYPTLPTCAADYFSDLSVINQIAVQGQNITFAMLNIVAAEVLALGLLVLM